MKHNFTTAAIAIALLACSATANAQSETAKNAEYINVGVGGTFGKSKIMTHLDKLGIAQITVNYKLTTTERTVAKDKSSGKVAGAKITAFMETTDGDLTAADLQEVTDHFYHYFQNALKKNGIDTVAWSAITASDFYKSADDKTEDGEEEKKNGQVWITRNANNGNKMYGGNIGFAFGKGVRAVKFAKQFEAPMGFFHITVDFADVLVNMEIRSGSHVGYYQVTTTTTKKYATFVKANMKVTTCEMGHSMLLNEKGVAENILLDAEIESNAPYHTSINEDRSRLKNNLFGFAKQMDPVVIETTRAKYKEAAKVALEKYADAFIEKSKQMKKG